MTQTNIEQLESADYGQLTKAFLTESITMEEYDYLVGILQARCDHANTSRIPLYVGGIGYRPYIKCQHCNRTILDDTSTN